MSQKPNLQLNSIYFESLKLYNTERYPEQEEHLGLQFSSATFTIKYLHRGEIKTCVGQLNYITEEVIEILVFSETDLGLVDSLESFYRQSYMKNWFIDKIEINGMAL